MKTLFDNPISTRPHAARIKTNNNWFGFARPCARISGKNRCPCVPTRAKIVHFARPLGTPWYDAKRRPLSGNKLATSAQQTTGAKFTSHRECVEKGSAFLPKAALNL